jgi:PAS domain S-box-containing protein
MPIYSARVERVVRLMRKPPPSWRKLSTQVRRLLCLLVLAAWTGFLHAETLTVGILSFRPDAETSAHWQPLMDYLSLAVPGKHFELKALSYPELNVAIARNEVDFVFTNPAHYIELRHRVNLSGALATVVETEDGHPLSEFGGTIFTLKERRDIDSLHDVVGKLVAIPDASSLGGYHMQAFELVQAGVALPDADHLMMTGTPHDKAILAVVSGKADIGFARAGVIEHMIAEGKLEVGRLKVLHRIDLPDFPFASSTRLYPEWPFIVLPHVDARISRRVASALLAIEPGSHLMKSVGPRGFAVPADYSPVEEVMRELRVPPFDTPLQVTLRDIWLRYESVLIVVMISSGIILVMMFRLVTSNRNLQGARHRNEQVMSRLRRQDEFLHNITENLPALILYWDSDERCRFANRHAADAFGVGKDELIGKTLLDAMGPENYSLDNEQVEGALRGIPQEYERPYPLPSGDTGYHLVNLVPDRQGHEVAGFFELITDITHQKLAAEERIAWAISQRDALVREVHHRIKNNLQSVGSLLQKELGAFPDFAPRLQRAMDQLHTLSVVHGLQTTTAGEHIILIGLLQQICTKHGEQTSRTIDLQSSDATAYVDSITIIPTEAVGVSLILNELITNACKHSPDRSSVRVRVGCEEAGMLVRIEVINEVAGTLPNFSVAHDPQSGAGFRLMKALLPLQGASLTVRAGATGVAVATLILTKPTIAS